MLNFLKPKKPYVVKPGTFVTFEPQDRPAGIGPGIFEVTRVDDSDFSIDVPNLLEAVRIKHTDPYRIATPREVEKLKGFGPKRERNRKRYS